MNRQERIARRQTRAANPLRHYKNVDFKTVSQQFADSDTAYVQTGSTTITFADRKRRFVVVLHQDGTWELK